jgi:uncharacterized protein
MIFTNVIKPTHICNLACKYCYVDDVRKSVMNRETLERTISETFLHVSSTSPDALASFIWHGGEPMVAKPEFYQSVIELQEEYSGNVCYENSIQTNGTLINNNWIEFFKDNNFKISISIDGPRSIHDKNRVDHSGKGSYERVYNAIQLVKASGLSLGVCVVISSDNRNHVNVIYDFLVDLDVPFNIIPMNKSGSAKNIYSDIGLGADEYAEPWMKMYDRWFDANDDYIYCSDFVFKTRSIVFGKPIDCIGAQKCATNNVSTDPAGNVYPCASLSGEKSTCYGNINEHALSELLSTDIAKSYIDRQVDHQCAQCKWQHICHGGCHARSYKFFSDHNKRDYYCPSLYRIYEHIESKLESKLRSM